MCKKTTRLFLPIVIVLSISQAAQAQNYVNNPFDPSMVMPANYYGYDPEVFVRQLQVELSKKPSTQKDEFETTEQFKKRLQTLQINPPILESAYAFSTLPTETKYDADAGTYTFNFQPQLESEGGQFLTIALKDGARDMGDYEAENGFGATFKVTRTLFYSYFLEIPKTSDLYQCSKSVKLAPEDARALKPRITVLLVVRVTSPSLAETRDFTNPTFSEPHENTKVQTKIPAAPSKILFYDRSNGNVLAACP
jgi:hypothetical protein